MSLNQIKEIEKLKESIDLLEEVEVINYDVTVTINELMSSWFSNNYIQYNDSLEKWAEEEDSESWYYLCINDSLTEEELNDILARYRNTIRCSITSNTYCQKTIEKTIEDFEKNVSFVQGNTRYSFR